MGSMKRVIDKLCLAVKVRWSSGENGEQIAESEKFSSFRFRLSCCILHTFQFRQSSSSVCKKAQKNKQLHFMAVENSRTGSRLRFIHKESAALTAVKRDATF